MTSFDSKLLKTIANKVSVDSEFALKKASEYLRLLQLRISASSGLRLISDTSRTVMCLDLACVSSGCPVDKNDLIRLAGVSKKQYSNGLHLIESLLDLAKPVNINTLCVQCAISEVAPVAQKILNKYMEIQSQGPNSRRPIDLNLPVYHCVAVFMACKLNKVKVDRSKLVDASRVKKVQFDQLVEDFAPILESTGIKDDKKPASKRSHKLITLVNQLEEESKKSNNSNNDRETTEMDEDFEVWKKRILSEAEVD